MKVQFSTDTKSANSVIFILRDSWVLWSLNFAKQIIRRGFLCKMHTVSYLNYFRKTSGVPKSEAPKQGHKIFKIMKWLVRTQYVQNNWNWKKNKKNKSTSRYANKSLFVQNFRSLFLIAYPAIVMGLKYIIYACTKFLTSYGSRKDAVEIQLLMIHFCFFANYNRREKTRILLSAQVLF